MRRGRRFERRLVKVPVVASAFRADRHLHQAPLVARAVGVALAVTVALLAFAATLLFAGPPSRAAAKGLPDAILRPGTADDWIALPVPDSQALWQLGVGPQPIAGPPASLGSGITIRSGYWAVLRQCGAHVTGCETDFTATGVYYPSQGVIAVDGEHGAAWFRADASRRALLDRYASLLALGALPSDAPTELEVLVAARWRLHQEVSVAVDAHPIAGADASDFWRFAGLMAQPAADVPASDIDAPAEHYTAVVLRLPEGRAVEYTYSRAHNALFLWQHGWPSYPSYTPPPAFARWLDVAVAGAPAPRPYYVVPARGSHAGLWVLALAAMFLAVGCAALVASVAASQHAEGAPAH